MDTKKKKNYLKKKVKTTEMLKQNWVIFEWKI